MLRTSTRLPCRQKLHPMIVLEKLCFPTYYELSKFNRSALRKVQITSKDSIPALNPPVAAVEAMAADFFSKVSVKDLRVWHDMRLQSIRAEVEDKKYQPVTTTIRGKE